MQAFRLVNGGFVDRVIVFDSLPDRLLKDIRTRQVSGLPRAWARWLASIESVRPVMRTETIQHPDRSYSFKYTPIGKEPCFYILEYTDVNADKESWRFICEYLRQNVTPDVRLKERIEDMAIPMAATPKDQLAIEPEDVPVIPVPPEVSSNVSDDEILKADEQFIVETPKKRGRPKKVAEVAS